MNDTSNPSGPQAAITRTADMATMTPVLLLIEHHRPITDLAQKVAGRAWTIDGVISAEVVPMNNAERLNLSLPKQLAALAALYAIVTAMDLENEADRPSEEEYQQCLRDAAATLGLDGDQEGGAA